MYERLPLVELLQADELVGFVRLRDVAGTADDSGDAAAGLEQAGLGPEGDLAVIVALGEVLGEGHHLRIGLDRQRRYGRDLLPAEAGVRVDLAHEDRKSTRLNSSH